MTRHDMGLAEVDTLTRAEKTLLANFGGQRGCSGDQPELMKLVRLGYLLRRNGTLHDHVFTWAVGKSARANDVRETLACEIAAELTDEEARDLHGRKTTESLILQGLGLRRGRRLVLTPLGRSIARHRLPK